MECIATFGHLLDTSSLDVICEERDRLEIEHAEAGTAFDSARMELRQRIGTSPKAEFDLLNKAVDKAWENLQRIRLLLDRHIREHRCQARALSACRTKGD